jgi:hypothetical protein
LIDAMNAWQKFLAPLLVFVLGAICGGGLVASAMIHRTRVVAENGPGEFTRVARRYLVRELGLDAQQRAALDPVFRDIEAQLAALRLENIPRIRRLVFNAESRIRPQLRPDQERKLDRLLAPPRARWQRLLPEKSANDSAGPRSGPKTESAPASSGSGEL